MNTSESLAILIADLGYGDAGKGSIVDYLARCTAAHTVVRYNGGAQAAHNVITPDGRQHTFAQFGSGTFVPGARTHLSQYMIVHPLAMLAEERHLRALGIPDAFERLTIERGALVTTPFQQAANRLKEMARGAARHGSCGMGVGETMADWLAYGSDVLFAWDLADRAALLKKLKRMREMKLAQVEPLFRSPAQARRAAADPAIQAELNVLRDPDTVEVTADLFAHLAGLVKVVEPDFTRRIFARPGVTLFEGAQGVLLDEWWGFAPYNSWSTLTFKNADALLAEHGYRGATLKLGLLRGYATRHGAGPFVSEDADLTALLPDAHNIDNPWQRQFRVGYLDLVALRYALQVTGPVDGLVVTNLDRMEQIAEWKMCESYMYPGPVEHLQGFFNGSGQQVREICVPANPTDLPRMEQRTKMLQEMQPVYRTCERALESYLAEISRALATPVAITSEGPTACEKESYLLGIGPARERNKEINLPVLAPG